MITYIIVLAVVKWEVIQTRWFQNRHRLSHGLNKLFKGPKSEKEKPSTEGEEKERPKSRIMNLGSKLRYRRGKKQGEVDEAHQLDEISPA
jgi:hypothetical protein